MLYLQRDVHPITIPVTMAQLAADEMYLPHHSGVSRRPSHQMVIKIPFVLLLVTVTQNHAFSEQLTGPDILGKVIFLKKYYLVLLYDCMTEWVMV